MADTVRGYSCPWCEHVPMPWDVFAKQTCLTDPTYPFGPQVGDFIICEACGAPLVVISDDYNVRRLTDEEDLRADAILKRDPVQWGQVWKCRSMDGHYLALRLATVADRPEDVLARITG